MNISAALSDSLLVDRCRRPEQEIRSPVCGLKQLHHSFAQTTRPKPWARLVEFGHPDFVSRCLMWWNGLNMT